MSGPGPRAQNLVHYNVDQWMEENEKYFLPPVCNKMMHDTQLKVFYVGGPNQRKDYHMEEGEELFFMRKGDMCLKILEQGKFKDVHIREGQIFLLPGKIPHSPQRGAQTVGLVIERDRLKSEDDGLRYYVEDGTTNSLFERWFYCDDLGSQLGPIIKEFFASEQFKTGKPIPEDKPVNPPWIPDSQKATEDPFIFQDWINKNRSKIKTAGSVYLFDKDRYQSDVLVLGKGSGARNLTSSGAETFLWQREGSATVTLTSNDEVKVLKEDETLLIPEGGEYKFDPSEDCVTLSVLMNPANKSRL